MSLKINGTTSPQVISPEDMKRGQIAEIVKWDYYDPHPDFSEGALILRMPNTGCYVSVCGTKKYPIPSPTGSRVRILPNGTLLEVTENE